MAKKKSTTDSEAPAKKRKTASISPTQRALSFCRKEGWTAAVCEKWNHHVKIRQDLFGFLDVIALDGRGVLGLQITSDVGHVSKRQQKISALPAAVTWLQAGARVEVWGWGKRGDRGKRKLWTLRRVYAALRDGKIEWQEDAPAVVRGVNPPTAALHPALTRTCPECLEGVGGWCRSTEAGFVDAQGRAIPRSLRRDLHAERLAVAEEPFVGDEQTTEAVL